MYISIHEYMYISIHTRTYTFTYMNTKNHFINFELRETEKAYSEKHLSHLGWVVWSEWGVGFRAGTLVRDYTFWETIIRAGKEFDCRKVKQSWSERGMFTMKQAGYRLKGMGWVLSLLVTLVFCLDQSQWESSCCMWVCVLCSESSLYGEVIWVFGFQTAVKPL